MTALVRNEGSKMMGEINLKTFWLISIFLLVMACAAAAGRTIYVDDDGPADFSTIQEAIDDSSDADTIIVQPGLYKEYISFYGKNITLTSTNPGDSNVVAATIIGGGVRFNGTEDADCTLRGFKINDGISGGKNHTHATISHCLLSGNITYGGTVIWGCDGTISNCVVVDNKTNSDVVGSAISECYGLIKNCTIAHNAEGIDVLEGGTTTIENCIIYHNGYGGQVWVISRFGSGATVNILYSDVQGGLEGIFLWDEDSIVNWGPGNIDTDPCFVRVGDLFGTFEGDYHLLPDSPCINAGDPNYIAEPNETDLDGKPRVIGGRVDMGAYEYRFTISAEARIIPRTINPASQGRWITCYIWLPEDYSVAEIEPDSILLEGEIDAVWTWFDEQEQVAIVRFNRSEVQSILNIGRVKLTITGQLTDGTVFVGTDVIRVLNKAGRKSAK
ncbi:MAG: hypothetical protein FVQ85_20795 [Planctomycetes bacterium]|nr:hypothetical protein [Planctomycetota bacterium]